MVERQSSLVVSARVDARDVATLALAWSRQTGVGPKSTSLLVKESLGLLRDMIVEKSPDLVVESVEQAYEIISSMDLVAHSDRSKRTLTRALQAEMGFGSATGPIFQQEQLSPLAGAGVGVGVGGWQAEQQRRMSLTERQLEYELAKECRDASIEMKMATREEAERAYKKRIKELDEKYQNQTKETIRRGLAVRDELKKTQPKLSHEQLQAKALEGLAQSYRTFVTSGMWKRQGIEEPEKKYYKDCVQKVWLKLNPQADERQLMEVYVQATELAAQLPASEAGTTQVVDTDLTPEQRAAREQAETEKMKQALAGGA
jgi:hypothetical protein